jgi:hypothetical protein
VSEVWVRLAILRGAAHEPWSRVWGVASRADRNIELVRIVDNDLLRCYVPGIRFH